MCQIWLQSDGRVEKKGGGGDRQTDRGTLQLYIVDNQITKPGKLRMRAGKNSKSVGILSV